MTKSGSRSSSFPSLTLDDLFDSVTFTGSSDRRLSVFDSSTPDLCTDWILLLSNRMIDRANNKRGYMESLGMWLSDVMSLQSRIALDRL